MVMVGGWQGHYLMLSDKRGLTTAMPVETEINAFDLIKGIEILQKGRCSCSSSFMKGI